MKVWINTFLAETYEEEAEKIDPNLISGRLEEYGPDMLPSEVLILTAAVDVHKMFVQVSVECWGENEENWGVFRRQIDGDTEKDEVWKKLDDELLQEFTREDGVKLKLSRVFVDMGYRDKRVLTFCAPRIARGVYPCKGIRREGIAIPPLLPAKPNRNNKMRIPHWPVGVTVAKSAIYDRILLPPPGPRTMHFCHGQGFDDAYFKELTVEVRKTKFTFGKPYSVFEKPNNASRNEALDLKVYNLAALHSMPPIAWKRLAENLKNSAPKERPAPVEPAAPQAGEAVLNEQTGKIEKAEPLPPSETNTPKPAAMTAGPKPPVDPHNPTAPQAPKQAAPHAMRPFRGRGRGGFVQGWR